MATQNKTNSSQGFQVFQEKSSNADCPASILEWSSYMGSELVNKLKTTTEDSCLNNLYVLDSPNVSEILFSNANIQAVADEMLNISASHNGTLNSGMYGLITYLHTALYQEFGQELVSLNLESKSSLRVAMESFADNEHLWNIDQTGLKILRGYLTVCDYTGLRHKDKILTVIKDAMKKLITEDNWKPLVDDTMLIYLYGATYNKIFLRSVVTSI